MGFRRIYEEKYKILLLIPFLLLLLALGQIGFQYYSTGDFVNRGITLKGGTTITLDYNEGLETIDLQKFLRERFPNQDILVRTLNYVGKVTGVSLELETQQREEIDLIIQTLSEKIALKDGSYTVEIIGSSLGNSFFKQMMVAVLIAFLLMGIVVFLYFRNWVTSLAVILAAASDIIVTAAIFNLTGIKLSSAGIAAFLMLIGYSVDTDILLNSRVLKRPEGTVIERVYGAIKTGLTMTATTLAAIIIPLIFVQNEIVKQIMIVLFIGLLVDLIMTYIQNAGMLRMYLEKRSR